jgi:hypothetical protein
MTTTTAQDTKLTPAQMRAVRGDIPNARYKFEVTNRAISCRPQAGDVLVTLGLATMHVETWVGGHSYNRHTNKRYACKVYQLTDAGLALRAELRS